MKTIWKVLIAIAIIIVLIIIGFIIYLKTAFISEGEVKNLISEDMNVSENDIHFESIDFELDEKVYEVELYYNNIDYEYKVNAENGRIIYTDYLHSTNNQNNTNQNNNQDVNTNQNNNQSTNNSQNNVQTTSTITLDEAKKIAFDEAGVTENEVNLTKTSSEREDGKEVYEIEFIYNNTEYDFTILKTTGEIIKYDKDAYRR